ncbi:hypothetical protein AMAG_04840 [Allomyces macrogynus ATCC 38327]|uniref:Uncharacterized protein n=1 Tax=Allomyces macrogynus (strain ATCC 38327) TaxID=578462 RepID=A0A0L0S634_ALLM3|nr:hypothetical protein AMAG_04840 [Allomyces macrogynus ATCC 38327]|eukprot:KNE58013.1 hypothetical protein AMAG_04840 [Allomyces macrogynus ATCC 38327]
MIPPVSTRTAAFRVTMVAPAPAPASLTPRNNGSSPPLQDAKLDELLPPSAPELWAALGVSIALLPISAVWLVRSARFCSQHRHTFSILALSIWSVMALANISVIAMAAGYFAPSCTKPYAHRLPHLRDDCAIVAVSGVVNDLADNISSALMVTLSAARFRAAFASLATTQQLVSRSLLVVAATTCAVRLAAEILVVAVDLLPRDLFHSELKDVTVQFNDLTSVAAFVMYGVLDTTIMVLGLRLVHQVHKDVNVAMSLGSVSNVLRPAPSAVLPGAPSAVLRGSPSAAVEPLAVADPVATRPLTFGKTDSVAITPAASNLTLALARSSHALAPSHATTGRLPPPTTMRVAAALTSLLSTRRVVPAETAPRTGLRRRETTAARRRTARMSFKRDLHLLGACMTACIAITLTWAAVAMNPPYSEWPVVLQYAVSSGLIKVYAALNMHCVVRLKRVMRAHHAKTSSGAVSTGEGGGVAWGSEGVAALVGGEATLAAKAGVLSEWSPTRGSALTMAPTATARIASTHELVTSPIKSPHSPPAASLGSLADGISTGHGTLTPMIVGPTAVDPVAEGKEGEAEVESGESRGAEEVASSDELQAQRGRQGADGVGVDAAK